MKTYMKRRHTPTLGQKHQRSKGTHQETHDQTQRGRMHMLNPTKRAHAQTHRDIIKFHTLILCSLYEFHTFILYSLHKFHTLILRVCVCVCESNSVPKRSKPLSWECSWCSCRGTQEAHRAVSNEALYGVFRISGLITLTYLHLWNCWQAVLIPCFPALGQRTTFPLTIPITLDQFSSRSIQFSVFFFNCFLKNRSEPSFFNFGSVPQFTLDRV